MVICILTSAAVLLALAVQSLLLYRLLRARPAAVPPSAEKEPKSPMDEGFDNIMRYGPGDWNGFGPEEQGG